MAHHAAARLHQGRADLDAWLRRSIPQLKDAEPLRSRAQARAQLQSASQRGSRSKSQTAPEVRELPPPVDIDMKQYRRFAEDFVEARFERMPGHLELERDRRLRRTSSRSSWIPQRLADRRVITIDAAATVPCGARNQRHLGRRLLGRQAALRRPHPRSSSRFAARGRRGRRPGTPPRGSTIHLRDVARGASTATRSPSDLRQATSAPRAMAVNCGARGQDANVVAVMERHLHGGD